ncbi:DUF4349 domain-containing protein [Actinophytocola sp.]|uniref:DUF4349 domain-containing protein n=1 Tax=Actinophytocola sp. TaxID=1872138 RepID=UPI00389B0F75
MNHRLVGLALMLGVATGLATACTSDSSDSASSQGAVALPSDSGSDSGSGSGSGGSKSPERADKPSTAENVSQPGVDRLLVRTANMDLSARDVLGTVGRARDVATTEGGYSGRENVRAGAATLTLLIPSDRFDRALDELGGLGRVTAQDQAAEDVTEQVVDLDSRVATQRASVDRVRALLARAGTVDEIVRIEQELTTREADLESLEQRRQALGGQVAMSTVTVRISKADAPPPPKQEERGGFLAGLSDGWDAFLDAGGVTLRVLGAVLPFVFVLGVPAALVLRWRRRRRPAVAQQP